MIADAFLQQILLRPEDYDVIATLNLQTLQIIRHGFSRNSTLHALNNIVCGVFTHDVAETLVGLVDEYARLNECPLLCVMEVV